MNEKRFTSYERNEVFDEVDRRAGVAWVVFWIACIVGGVFLHSVQ